MIFLPIYAILNTDSGVATAIDVPTKVYEDVAPHGTTPPYVIWQVIGGYTNTNLDDPSHVDATQYQLTVYAKSTKEAYEIRDLCRQALEKRSWINNPDINSYEYDTKLFARGFDGNFIHDRL